MYFGSSGERARPLIEYLERQCGSSIPRLTNPANWMLNVIGTMCTRTLVAWLASRFPAVFCPFDKI